MVTITLLHPSGKKETAHFQSIQKCAQWMNLHYKKVDQISFVDNKSKERFIFASKTDFEKFYQQRLSK